MEKSDPAGNNNTRTRTIVVVGATGDVGAEAATALARRGHRVRRVARSLGVPLEDASALAAAFAGADSAFVMIPFDVRAPDLHQFEDDVGARLAAAIAGSSVRRVVLLSGLNAHLKMGTSLGAAMMEDRLNALGLEELVHLRASFFMENLAKGMSFVQQAASGVFATPFRGDLPMPLIAASDVGQRVAILLDALDFPSDRVVELHGGSRYTLAEATAILGKEMGREVSYLAVPSADARAGMLQSGMSESFADALLETVASFNKGERWALEQPSQRNTTPTTFERWAENLAKASA